MAYKLRAQSVLRAEIETTKVPYGVLAIWSLGQAGFVLKNSANDILAIDPYLTRAIELNNPGTEFVRAFDPVLQPEDIACADAILISHHHDDHMDLATLQALSAVKREMPFYIPPVDALALNEAYPHLQGNIQRAMTGVEFDVGHFRIRPVASAHSEYEKNEQGYDRYLGFLITTDGITFYHSGDTLVTDELKEELSAIKPDIAVLPINGGDYSREKRGIIPNMGFRDAADLNQHIKADLILPFHYDMFTCNTDNPSYFVDYMLSAYPGNKFHMMVPGERFIYMK